MAITYTFVAAFTEDGTPLTSADLVGGDIPEIVVRRRALSGGALSTAQAATDMSADDTAKVWYYTLSLDWQTYEYWAMMTTSYAADDPTVWMRPILGTGQYETELGYLDGAISTAQADLDTLTGADGATLATAQANYAPAKAGDAMTLVDGAITAAKFAANAITAAIIAADAIGASELASDAVDEIVDQVWREMIADHSGVVGSTAEQLAAAGAGGDPWATAIPAAYASGQAGYILGNILASVWAYATRTLTQSAASIQSAVDGEEITITRGDTMSLAITGLGDITGNQDIWFGVKANLDDADSEADILISKSVGLEIIMGAVGTAGNGSITVNDASAGNITIALEAIETAKLSPAMRHYDIQWKDAAGDIHTLSIGVRQCTIQGDVTLAVS